MNQERIKEVFSDEAFVKSLSELETPEAVQAALKEKEVEMSVQEIMQLRDAVVANSSKKEELSLDELENVSGGALTLAAATIISACILGGSGIVGGSFAAWRW